MLRASSMSHNLIDDGVPTDGSASAAKDVVGGCGSVILSLEPLFS